ncbi:hypothetical protein N0V85_009358 [Neurospora sp. IMI 360204]|nr:hypothetical protein N0V85_009358 [Neurospora sp. IMI 360204]
MADPATPSRPAKHQRTETIDLTSNSGDLIAAPGFGKTHTGLPSSQISRLPATFTSSLLAYAATRDPYINSILAHQYDLQRTLDRASVINFSHCSQIVWNLLNIEYVSFSRGPKSFEMAFDMVSDISEMVGTILDTVRKGGGNDCSYRTKNIAVETIVDIMTNMVEGSPQIRHEARNYVHEATEMEKKLLEMMNYFAEDELAQLDKKG